MAYGNIVVNIKSYYENIGRWLPECGSRRLILFGMVQSRFQLLAVLLSVVFALPAGIVRAQTTGPYKDLHDFGGSVINADQVSGPDGGGPVGGVMFDKTGNMYGTSSFSGANGGGIVWEITTSGVYLDLHDFAGTVVNADGSSGPDGEAPFAGVTFNSAGNMYGTTDVGGRFGFGIVWEITQSGQYKDLHDFGGTVVNADGKSGPDGGHVYAGVTFDSAGNMYGTTNAGGPIMGGGIVWEITTTGAYKDLHDFNGKVVNASGLTGPDGTAPTAGVTFDSLGNMYGTSRSGGANGPPRDDGGIVWEITKTGKYIDLHDFGGTVVNADGSSGPDGNFPYSGVTFDSVGNMYGTTEYGGPAGDGGSGMVWKITKAGEYIDLHDFGATVDNANGTRGPDGITPETDVAVDSAGNLYGTASGGGPNYSTGAQPDAGGIVWEITASGAYRDLHDFGGADVDSRGLKDTDSVDPRAGVIFDSGGNMYGTAYSGTTNFGNVWMIVALPPTAKPQTVSIAHNTAKSITLTGTDPNNLPLTYAVATAPGNGTLGTLNPATGVVTYTPGANFHGTDSFTFTASAGTNTSAPAKITLNVTEGIPTAKALSISLDLGRATTLTLTGTDLDIPALKLSFAIAEPPVDGVLEELNSTTGAVTYTPKAGFRGTDNFTFNVSNGTNTSAAATVTLKVAPGTPTANSQTVAVAHNTAKAITLTGTDPDSPALKLTFAIAAKPAHGSLGILNTTSGTVTYAPTANFHGSDSFTFTVSNGTVTSATAAVTLNVAVGTPTANAQTVPVAHSSAKAITLTGTDADSPALKLTFAIAAKPAHGTLGTLNATTGAVTFTPATNFQGADSFTFTVSNGTSKSVPATVMLKVAAGTPTANAQTVAVLHNTAKPITLTGTDPDSPALKLTFAIGTKPAHGTLSTLNGSTGAVTFTPATNFQGTDSFTFTVSNGTSKSAPATVTLKVAPGTPTANVQTVAVIHNTAKPVALTGTDPDSPALKLTFAIVTKPTHGTLSTLNTTTGAVTYTPTTNFQGTDGFTFTVSNGTNKSAAAAITLKVAPGTPTANAQTAAVAHNTTKAITLTGTDADVPVLKLTFAIVAKPAHGTLSTLNASTGAVTYTPTTNFQGADSFTFTVSNGTNKSAAAAITLKVAPGTPTAIAQTAAVAHNTAKAITLTGTDADVPVLKLTFAIVAKPTHGTLSTLNVSTGAVTYTPAANFQGSDSFTFTVSNGTNKSAAATVTLKVAPGTPTANSQTVTVTLNTKVAITLTGSDPDVPALQLTFAIATKPAHGALGSLNTSTGVVDYTPDATYRGVDSFTFTVSNGTNKSAAATVTLKVDDGG